MCYILDTNFMRRVFLFLAPVFLALGVFFTVAFFLNQDQGKGALQVTSSPKSKVFLNGKPIGVTPLCKCEGADMIAVGDYTIRLEPEQGNLLAFEEKIKISKSILTVVDRTFGQSLSSEGSIISLNPLDNKKTAEILAISFPEGAEVFLDSNSVGKTPLLLKDVTESDHELKIKKQGYNEKSVRIRTVAGFKLSAVIFLSIKLDNNSTSSSQNETKEKSASPSASPTITRIVILETPTGFLRVREEGSLNAAEIGRVNPGETYDLINEKQGWFEIRFKEDKNGWISSRYAKKQ